MRYPVLSLLVALAVFVGFAPTFYLRAFYQGTSPSAGPLPLHLVVHGVLFTAWFAWLLMQTALIRLRRVSWHRTLGWLGVALAVAVTVAGVTAGVLTARREAAFVAAADVRAFLAIPLFSMAAFAGLVAAAVLLRGRPEAHGRLMLLATISILDAPIARWPGAPGATGVFVIVDLIIAMAMAMDVATRGRPHAAYLAGGAFVVASQLLRDVVGGTAMWQGLAGALIG